MQILPSNILNVMIRCAMHFPPFTFEYKNQDNDQMEPTYSITQTSRNLSILDLEKEISQSASWLMQNFVLFPRLI